MWHVVHATFVQEIRCTSSMWFNTAEPIPAGIVRSARQSSSNCRELAAELDVEKPKSRVLFCAPSSTVDRRIEGIHPSISDYLCRTLIVQLLRNCCPTKAGRAQFHQSSVLLSTPSNFSSSCFIPAASSPVLQAFFRAHASYLQRPPQYSKNF
jgi:hypothetical protein